MPASTTVEIKADSGSMFTVAGYAVVYGGQDIVGDYFASDTDFWFDRVGQNPLVLYQHGQDSLFKRTVVGRVIEKHSDDVGLWVEAQINAAKKYADAIRELVRSGVLGWSSGSVPHLVQRTKGSLSGTQKITSWPIVEISLTPTPAEPRTVGVKELKSLATLEPSLESLIEPDAEVEDGRQDDAKATQGLARSDYAWVDSGGTGHLDISDEGHVRAAMARFNQTHFSEPGAKRSAAKKILARARSMGIEVDPNSAVANAAKGVNMNDLPDEAFGYVEPGFLDDSGKTSPRDHRHYPHHDEDGNLDPELLTQSISEAKAAGDLGEHALAHLLRHQQGGDDAHTKFWSETSVAGQLLVLQARIGDLLEPIVTAQKAMDYIGHQQAVERVQPEPTQTLKELNQRFEAVIAHAEQAETGDDGTARADYLRRRLALLEV